MLARMPMMDMTISNSISVKPRCDLFLSCKLIRFTTCCKVYHPGPFSHSGNKHRKYRHHCKKSNPGRPCMNATPSPHHTRRKGLSANAADIYAYKGRDRPNRRLPTETQDPPDSRFRRSQQ